VITYFSTESDDTHVAATCVFVYTTSYAVGVMVIVPVILDHCVILVHCRHIC